MEQTLKEYETILSYESHPLQCQFNTNFCFIYPIKMLTIYIKNLHKAYFFCVGDAQNITTLSLYIIVIECEHTIEECVLTIFK